MIAAAGLTTLIAEWLPSQRWFAGKGRDHQVEVGQFAELPREVGLWYIRVSYADGPDDLYQLPVVVHEAAVEGLAHALIGSAETEDGTHWIYDALHDKEVTPVWLEAIRDNATHGAVTFHCYVKPDEIPVDEPSLVLTAEQSNTSLVFGDFAIMKVFRRLQPGVNPDIELHAALGEYGARHIARMFGSAQAQIDGQPYALAMLQEFLTTATDGWDLANSSVRDLFAERDLHASEAGGDFAAEAARLGMAVAETHEDLAAAFGTTTATSTHLAEQAEQMRRQLRSAVTIVPDLAEFTDAISASYDAFESLHDPLRLQRVHGDLHLGQALRTVHRWVLIDFEGQPLHELAQRRAPDSPLRDVAGMLRSFEYAGYHRLVETGGDAQLAYRAEEWVTRNRAAFCEGFTAAAGYDPRDSAVALRAYELDKVVYEAMYEARQRPTWLPIPLASLRRLLATEVAS